jgi:hypothetical protein
MRVVEDLPVRTIRLYHLARTGHRANRGRLQLSPPTVNADFRCTGRSPVPHPLIIDALRVPVNIAGPALYEVPDIDELRAPARIKVFAVKLF